MNTSALLQQTKRRYLKQTLSRLLQRRSVIFAGFTLGTLFFCAFFAPFITCYDPFAISIAERLQPPGFSHYFGTDELGRDIFARILYGGRTSLTSIAIVSFLSAPLGFFLGMYAGFKGGVVDLVVGRIVDMFFAFPRLILALVTVAFLGPGLFSAILAISFTSWPAYVRLARIEALEAKNKEFMLAAKLQGVGDFRFLYKYLLPICLPSFIVRLTLDLGTIILNLASIGFLGLGAQAPTAEWGAMAAFGRDYLLNQWWITLVPGIFVLLTSLSFNLLGEALRDALDPHMEAKWLS